MVKISKLFEIAKPYQLTIRGIKGDIEVYLVGYGKGMGQKVSYEDADRMGKGKKINKRRKSKNRKL